MCGLQTRLACVWRGVIGRKLQGSGIKRCLDAWKHPYCAAALCRTSCVNASMCSCGPAHIHTCRASLACAAGTRWLFVGAVRDRPAEHAAIRPLPGSITCLHAPQPSGSSARVAATHSQRKSRNLKTMERKLRACERTGMHPSALLAVARPSIYCSRCVHARSLRWTTLVIVPRCDDDAAWGIPARP